MALFVKLCAYGTCHTIYRDKIPGIIMSASVVKIDPVFEAMRCNFSIRSLCMYNIGGRVLSDPSRKV